MDSGKTITLSFASSLTDQCSLNASFDMATLRIAYYGKNQNGSYIAKETFEKCLDTIYNKPVVCHYIRETDELGGHDVEVLRDENGLPKLVNITQPVGVVPESAETFWQTVQEDDGTEHEYLCTQVLLWKRQEAYEKIKSDGFVSHSMEIAVKDGDIIDGVFHINDFEFKAFCLIGVNPCFESSALTFSSETFNDQFFEMMHDLKESLNDVTSPEGDDNIHPQKNYTEGGKGILDEKMKLVEKYGIDVEALDFSVEDFTVEELEEKFEAMKPAEEEAPTQTEDESFALASEMFDEITRVLAAETMVNRWNEVCPKYCYVDCDFEKREVYAWDISDWLLYGMSFEQTGDSFKIDFDSRKRKKYVIEDFAEGESEQPSPFIEMYSSLEERVTANEDWESKYNAEHEAYESLNAEVEELREFKSNTENEKDAQARGELFAKFADLNGVDEYEELKGDNKDLALDALEEKLFALRGRNMQNVNFAQNPVKTPKIKVEKDIADDAPYGGIVERYNKN